MSPPFQWAAGGMKTRLGERRQNDATSVSYLKQGPKRTLAASLPLMLRDRQTDALRYPRG